MNNRPILSTPFNGQTLQTTGPGVDSGFASVDDVIAVLFYVYGYDQVYDYEYVNEYFHQNVYVRECEICFLIIS